MLFYNILFSFNVQNYFIGGGYPRGSNGKDSDWFTLGVAVESNDITVTVDHESQNGDGTSILRMVQEENPTKTIVRGSFGKYLSEGACIA